MDDAALQAETASLLSARRRRRRLANASFFVAGIGFGTLVYLLRARFQLVRGASVAFLALVAITVGAFWLGARAESDLTQLDERLRELEASARARRH